MRFSSERIINGHNFFLFFLYILQHPLARIMCRNWAGSREKHRGSEPTRVDKVRKGAKNTE